MHKIQSKKQENMSKQQMLNMQKIEKVQKINKKAWSHHLTILIKYIQLLKLKHMQCRFIYANIYICLIC